MPIQQNSKATGSQFYSGMPHNPQITADLNALKNFKTGKMQQHILYSIYTAAANYTISVLIYEQTDVNIKVNCFSFQMVKIPSVEKNLTWCMHGPV